MGYINLSNYIYSPSNIRNINLLFKLKKTMKQFVRYYQIKNNRTIEIKRKNIKYYLDKQSIFIYNDNLEVKGILTY